jgi:4-phytase/acid phosphatase
LRSKALPGFAAVAAALALAGPAAAEALKLEAVATVMRHGVRPPTKAQPMPPGFADRPWPAWPVAPGFLTPHGADGARALGRAARKAYAARGLVTGGGCPAAGSVLIWADTDQRTVSTGEAWAQGFAPGCALPVGRAPADPDPLFAPIEAGAVDYDPAAAKAAVEARLPAGGAQALADAHRSVLQRLGAVYGCCAPAICAGSGVSAPCGLADLPTRVAASARGRPRLEGALDLGSTAAQILVLEYADGRPAADVGFGRATAADVSALAVLHPLEFDVLARPPYMAARNAGPLARRLLAALQADDGRRLTLLVGHDTNLASLGGLFDLHWQAPGYPADDPPPGGALSFERLRAADGQAYVRVVFIAQGLEQLRMLAPDAPVRQALPLPGCDSGPQGTCPLAAFARLVNERAAPSR